jgi:putative ABC transport system substrate-binding protein
MKINICGWKIFKKGAGPMLSPLLQRLFRLLKLNILKPGRFLSFAFLLCTAVFADDSPPEILLLNSDFSVEKYRIIDEEFRKTLSSHIRVTRVDMKLEISAASAIKRILASKNYRLIYCVGSKAYLLANQYAGEKPLIFSSVINWQRMQVTDKTYGVSNELHTGMQITLFRYIFPKIKKIGVLYSREFSEEWFETAKAEAGAAGAEIIGRRVSGSHQTLTELKDILPDAEALWLISDPVVMPDKNVLLNILKLCDRQKLPVFSYNSIFATFGAVLAVSVDAPTIGRQASGIAEELLSGSRPDEKVVFPAGTHIILNLHKVKAYGIQYNEESLGSVNQIIE